MADLRPRRPDAAFVFEVSDLEPDLDIDHQYDRSAGVPRPGQPLVLRVGATDGLDEVSIIGLVSGRAVVPAQIEAEGTRYPARRVAHHWEAVLPGMDDGTILHYLVSARDERRGLWYADGRQELADATVFTHRVTSRRPPSWTRQAVVYQVFVDRFADGAGPVPAPDDPHSFAGGDLHGVTGALPYLSDLGVNTLWLTPVFAAHSYHGYDTVDFAHVDERFGGDAALADLVTAADQRGIRIVLDFVPNHVSNHHPWFIEAQQGGATRDWFTFREDGSYATFSTSLGMPKVNLLNPDAVDAMVEAASYWVSEFGVDGYRIDHVLGPEESFFATLSAELNAHHPDAWLFGEATASAAFCRRYGGILDGGTDFMLAYAWRDLFSGKLSIDGFIEIEQEAAAILPHDDFSWVRFFDNHDMSRALHLWEGDTDRLLAASGMLLTLPGVPSLFYGTEQGLTHELTQEAGGLAVGRIPMRFDDPAQLLHPLRDGIRARTSHRHLGPVYWTSDGTTARWDWDGLHGTMSIPE